MGSTGSVNRNLYVMLKFAEQPKTPGITSKKKTWFSLKRISCFQVVFVLIWMKQTLMWFNLQRNWTENGLSNTKDTFAESLQLQMQFWNKVCASSSLASQVHMMAKQNIKRSTWCVRSQSKWWNNMQFQTQVYIT